MKRAIEAFLLRQLSDAMPERLLDLPKSALVLRYSRLQEVGSYAEKWVCRAIYEMSRPPQTLRVPPAREGFWGPFEKLVYSEFARQVHRR